MPQGSERPRRAGAVGHARGANHPRSWPVAPLRTAIEVRFSPHRCSLSPSVSKSIGLTQLTAKQMSTPRLFIHKERLLPIHFSEMQSESFAVPNRLSDDNGRGTSSKRGFIFALMQKRTKKIKAGKRTADDLHAPLQSSKLVRSAPSHTDDCGRGALRFVRDAVLFKAE